MPPMDNWGQRTFSLITAQDVIQLLGRALVEESFRIALLDNPEQTLKELGYKPLTNMVEFLKGLKDKGLDTQFEEVRKQYEALGGPRNA